MEDFAVRFSATAKLTVFLKLPIADLSNVCIHASSWREEPTKSQTWRAVVRWFMGRMTSCCCQLHPLILGACINVQSCTHHISSQLKCWPCYPFTSHPVENCLMRIWKNQTTRIIRVNLDPELSSQAIRAPLVNAASPHLNFSFSPWIFFCFPLAEFNIFTISKLSRLSGNLLSKDAFRCNDLRWNFLASTNSQRG